MFYEYFDKRIINMMSKKEWKFDDENCVGRKGRSFNVIIGNKN